MTAETVPLNCPAILMFPQSRPMCVFGACAIYPAQRDGLFLLYMVNENTETLTTCTYDDWKEWREEMHVLRRAAQGGGSDWPPTAGVTANLPPSPPAAPASNAHALPTAEETFFRS